MLVELVVANRQKSEQTVLVLVNTVPLYHYRLESSLNRDVSRVVMVKLEQGYLVTL